MTDTLDFPSGDSSSDSRSDAPSGAPSGGPSGAAKKRAGGLNGMLVADLKAMASALGIAGAGSMKKPQLVAAIKAAGTPTGQATGQGSGQGSGQASAEQSSSRRSRSRSSGGPSSDEQSADPSGSDRPERAEHREGTTARERRTDERSGGQAPQRDGHHDGPTKDGASDGGRDGARDGAKDGATDGGDSRSDARFDRDGQRPGSQQNQHQSQNQSQNQGQGQGHNAVQGTDDEQGGSRRNRRRRGRGERDRTTGGGAETRRQRSEPDTQILEDDVLVPAAGILDVLDNYAFVRTSGYLPGTDDVYLSLSLVRKFGLRRGDAIVGMVRQPREGERKEKFNPMVRVDAVNGADPEAARNRPDITALTPIHPQERLRLEIGPETSGPDRMIGRVIDLAAPIGKGQRGLILAPAKSGKTRLLQSISRSITANNPECHLMVVLVDERPEEVTDYERSVKGEVVSSTFDRQPSDHTAVAELAIERAKRLVELGHDVVVLLDGITRLGRAYSLSLPASGRVLSGGVDAASLYPPKRFFGAARNLEDGGSLTILATVQVDGASAMDEMIFEDIKDTANLEIRLSRELADRGLVPAVDIARSGNRREDLLMSEGEAAALDKLRRDVAGKDPAAALESLLGRLAKTPTNLELLSRL